jgi:DNA-binding transcriptional LysR family regulator
MLSDELAQIDVHTLQLLVIVHDTGSFSVASNQLGISQSTVSYAIERLRKAFSDPLFVRQGNRITETDKCRDLVSQAREIVNRLQAIAAHSDFDPATAEGIVTLSCNHHERFLLVPAFLKAMRSAAPKAVLGLLESAVNGKRQLKENAADIVLGPVRILGDGYFRRHLFTDHYSCVMDPTNPLADGELTLERYRHAAHVAVTHNGQWQALYFEALRLRDIAIKPQLTLPSHDNLDLMIKGTDLVATIPNRLARAFETTPEHAAEKCERFLDNGKLKNKSLAVRPFPIHIPIEIDMYWTERTHRSGLHKWARQLLVDVARAHAPAQVDDAAVERQSS